MQRRQETGGSNHPAPGRSSATRGSNQKGMRAYNERLVLTLVRRYGSLAKSQIARITGLSAQTVSVIMRALEAEELLIRGTPQRGRVGQPMVPLALNPAGAFSLGLMIGRRNCEMILVDFIGEIRDVRRTTFRYPVPEELVSFTRDSAVSLINSLPRPLRSRVGALGVSKPFNLGRFSASVGTPPEIMAAWQDFDVRKELGKVVSLPVSVHQDGTAACGAELMLGHGAEHSEFLYVFIGLFASGGVVLNGSLYPGRTGNAGALASMPVPAMDGSISRLLDRASIIKLERDIAAAGEDPLKLYRTRGDWSAIENRALIENWTNDAANSLAFAVAAACCVIDFPTVVIDGSFEEQTRTAMCEAVRRELQRLDLSGIQIPEIIQGRVGAGARSIGAACLPLYERYLLDQTNLLKGQAG